MRSAPASTRSRPVRDRSRCSSSARGASGSPTSAGLTDELTKTDEAFYGWFRTIPIGGLDPAEASALLDHEVGTAVLEDPRWPARREAIIVLSGGNPRALVALARAVRGAPGGE